ncbi:MAG: hypothetical protein AAFP82_07900 [Bacteroidota bacterium]
MEQDNRRGREEEISLKEIILKFLFYWQFIWKHKIWVILSFLFSGTLAFCYALSQPMIFEGRVTFTIANGDGNLSGISNILGQFGIGGSRDGPNPYKILELSKARAILKEVLFEEVVVGEQKDYLANHLIREYDYHRKWAKGEEKLKEFLFTHDTLFSFNPNEIFVLKILHYHIVNKGILTTSLDDVTNLMTLSVKTTSNEISASLAEKIYEHLKEYYTEKRVANQRKTFNIFKSKTDSIETELSSVQLRLSRFEDSNRNLLLRQYEIERVRLEQELQKLIIAYGESYKSQELADFSLKSQNPAIQMIDGPLRPLIGKAPSKYKFLVIGAFAGLLLSVFMLLIIKIFQEIMGDLY